MPEIWTHGNVHWKMAYKGSREAASAYFWEVWKRLDPYTIAERRYDATMTDPYNPAFQGYLWHDTGANLVWVGWTQADIDEARRIHGYAGPGTYRILGDDVLFPPSGHPAAKGGYRQPLPQPHAATPADLRRQRAMPAEHRRSALLAPGHDFRRP